MPTNISSRIVTISLVLLAAMWAIFPGIRHLPTAPFTGKKIDLSPDLRPGIDISGGTSLTYEIRSSNSYDPRVAEQVASVLKRRVDPEGVKNLIWRPSGNRLEIQMPLTKDAKAGDAIRAKLAAAQQQIEATNFRVGGIEATLADAATRSARISELSNGSSRRTELLTTLGAALDKQAAAKASYEKATDDAARDAALAEGAAAVTSIDSSRTQLSSTNLDIVELQAALELASPAKDNKLKAIRDRGGNFPARESALDAYAAAYGEYLPVKDTIDSAAALKRDLRGSGVLSFNILADDLSPAERQRWIERLQNDGPRPRPGDEARWFQVDKAKEFPGQSVEYNSKKYMLAYISPERSLMRREGQAEWALEQAGVRMSEGRNVVAFSFDPQGTRYFGDLTGRHVPTGGQRYRLGIVLDEKLISAPNLNSRIDGSGEISGDFTKEEVDYLSSTLNAGSLPAQLTEQPISERTVGPQLGEDNLKAGFIACLIGLIIVGVFMIGYYYTLGLVAFAAVLINVVLILGFMAALNATFTLAGIAGIVLTIGMAVDANVLIFERFREETERGLSIRLAMRNAYDRAFTAILDGNLTTAVTSLCLYLFGSEEVRGFGLTLLLGLVSSMFTALYVTKTIYAIMIDKFGVTKLGSFPQTFPKWNKALQPDIDWVAKTKIFSTFSAIFIGIGLAMFVVRWNQGQVLDIEFTGGTAVQFTLSQPTKINDVRDIIGKASERNPALPVPTVQSIGTDDKSYEVSTPNADTNAVSKAVVDAMGDKLDVQQPSSFVGSTQNFAEAFASGVIVPLETRQTTVEGIDAETLRNHPGGLAIKLDNLNPPLPAEQIRARLEQAAVGDGGARPWSAIDVFSQNGGASAVVLLHNTALPYDATNPTALTSWKESVAGKTWSLLNDAITSPAELQRVTKFDGQVASEAKTDTLIAMIFSIVGIMAYVWFRFGDLSFGTATVVALVHDTLFCLAAVGFAHYLSYIPFLHDALLIEPFRLNLVLIAAILTVMGYSMNDTVVVFDRVRENRGRSTTITRKLINDSVNQTLSRTLLTGTTTLAVTLVMYVFGGAGIHGFTYALFLGILVGTYSSIAIAAPILLLSKHAVKTEERNLPARQLSGASV